MQVIEAASLNTYMLSVCHVSVGSIAISTDLGRQLRYRNSAFPRLHPHKLRRVLHGVQSAVDLSPDPLDDGNSCSYE